MQKVLLYEEFSGGAESAQRFHAGPVAVIRLPLRPEHRMKRMLGRPAPHAKPVAQLVPAQPELTHSDCAHAATSSFRKRADGQFELVGDISNCPLSRDTDEVRTFWQINAKRSRKFRL